ncbi:hypothetical protein [Flavobacterium sp.]|jgi:hypothetical protein|uniref:hypothetical protein n=1 Tax=Flavobacterium sp. TaxID=239 RepID=UPI0037BEE742
MKKIFLFCILISFFSCSDIQYDGEKRLVFKTTIRNANNEPLPNSYVEVSVGVNQDDLISKGNTNQNGEITLIFPSPQSNTRINLKIYNEETGYMPKEIFNIKKTDFINYLFEFQNARLLKNEEVVPLNLSYNQTNINNSVRKVSIVGIYHLNTEFYNFDPESFSELPNQILIKKNQSFQLRVTVYNSINNSETTSSVNLSIVNDAVNYTINY